MIGLETIAKADLPDRDINTVLDDISAASFVREFNIAGVYAELLLQISSTAGGSEIAYSELLHGYDLGSSDTVNIMIYTPNKLSTGSTGTIEIKGAEWETGTLSFDATGVASYDVNLYQGDSWVSVCDSGNSTANPPKPQLCTSFIITTTGGIEPVIQISSIVDNTGATLTGDASQYYIASSTAENITISGIVTDPTVSTLSFNIWNEYGPYGASQAQVNSGTFSVTMDIYQGENWISVYGSDSTGSYSEEYVGVYTDGGAVWEEPVTLTGVSESTLKGDYITSSDWSANPGSDYTVSITGKFKIPQDGSYYVSSDGGYVSGTIKALSDASFSVNVLLYNGWNYVYLYDSTGVVYIVNIYTSYGQTVVKPIIKKINSATYSGSGSAFVSGCSALIEGTSLIGPVSVNITGYGQTTGGAYTTIWESQAIQATGLTDPGFFKAYVPVASGTRSYTIVDVFDKDNKVTSVRLSTLSYCSYAQPAVTFVGVKDSSGTSLVQDGNGNYLAGTSNTVTLYGTSNRAGHAVSAEMQSCGELQQKTSYASTTLNGSTYDWTMSFKVYGTAPSGINDIYLKDGTGQTISIYSENTVEYPAPAFATFVNVDAAYGTPSVVSKDCNSAHISVGTADTVGLSGSTTSLDGLGYYTDPLNGNHSFTISGGNFLVPDFTVYSGYNYIYLYDTDNNYFKLNIETSNTNTKPQYVAITQPANNASVSGTVTVAGTVTAGAGYSPKTVYAYVYNSAAQTYKYYSSDFYDQITYKYGALSYNGYDFSFSHEVGSDTASLLVDVYAYDNVNGVNHGHTIYLNESDCSYYYKPGAKTGVQLDDGWKKLLELDKMKREMQIMSKTR